MAVVLNGTGVFSNNVRALQKLVASSATFQELCGVSTEIAALAHVHSPEASDRDDDDNIPDPRPRAIVLVSAPARMKKGCASWSNAGQSYLSLEFNTPDAFIHSPEHAFSWLLEKLDAITREMEINSESGGNGYLNMIGWRTIDGPAQAIKDNENQQDFWGVTLEIDWY